MEIEELMQRYCDGDEGAFSALYATAAPRLLGYLMSLAHDRGVAEDLLQETFLKIHNARSAYVRAADPLPWFYAIAHRTFLDHARRNRRARVRLHHDEQLPEIEARLDGERADEDSRTVVDPQLQAAMRGALEQLPASQREALRLTKLEGLSPTRAAEALGVSAGAIKLRAHRAIANLRSFLGVGDGDEDAVLDRLAAFAEGPNLR